MLEIIRSEHIGTADLAKLLEESRQRADSALDAPNVHPHLAVCPTCREQYEELALLERQLDRQLSSKPVESAQRESDCPAPGVRREISGALTQSDTTHPHVEHASHCDYSAP